MIGRKLAVLIDADNAQASVIDELFAEVATYGIASVRRAYGDWTTPNLRGWKDALHRLAIQPIQQFSYAAGKNSTDCSLIIDAMDLLYAGNVDGFCLVSSDSDFTRLANRIREAGLLVYGFGERKAPAAFVAACDKFVFTEILRREQPTVGRQAEAPPAALEPLIRTAVDANARDDGWASLAAVGSTLLRSSPSFDSRNYGCRKLGDLVRKQRYLEVKEVPDGDGNAHLYVRVKGA